MKRWHFKDCVKILCHNNKQYEYKLVCGKSTPLPKATASKRKGKNAPKEAKSYYRTHLDYMIITQLYPGRSIAIDHCIVLQQVMHQVHSSSSSSTTTSRGNIILWLMDL